MSTDLDSKTVFTTLSEGLKDAYKELLDFGLKVNAATVIVIGWFAAQKNPLAFLCAHEALVPLALVLVAVGFGVVCMVLIVVFRRAKEAYDQLTARGYERPLFARYQVTLPMLVGGFLGEALVLGGVFWFVLYKYGFAFRATCMTAPGGA